MIAALGLLALPAAAPGTPGRSAVVEVVVTLKRPPSAQVRRASQATVAARIAHTIPGASIRWRYTVVLDGLAVVVPATKLDVLKRIPGVARVWPSATYGPQLDRTPRLIGATTVWGPNLATAGQGMKIGIIDEGIDQTHPFFDSTGYAYPPGFPKGDTRYTTPKVIVARAFAPPGITYPYANLPFDPKQSDHGTHVAGIAAGNNGTLADGIRISGIAPRAYLGNYKALSIPTPGVGLNGNAPELVAAIEAAVTDGMNVINLSLGEPEIDPSRDVVVQALDGAARAGVVPVVAVGNDYQDFGNGSIDSPANAPDAIAVAASSGGHGSSTTDRILSFSSAGPTPYSLRLKPDVSAPGDQVLSSVPAREGTWTELSGTSMAAPHVAGAAALLEQRHPDWTVAQIKSALMLTGAPVLSGGREVPATREGGGRIDLVQADGSRIFAAPSSLSFGLIRPGRSVSRSITLADAGGGGGTWTVGLQLQARPANVAVVAPQSTNVPGTFSVQVSAGPRAREGDVTGFVVLRAADGTRRRIPLWSHVERPRLALDRAAALVRSGVHHGTTVSAPSRVSAYRYPDLSRSGLPLAIRLPGPEVVYRFRLTRPVPNFGVVVTGQARAMHVEPRIVRAGDENRLAGYTALPIDLNDYRSTYGEPRPVAGVVLPAPGTYDVVFDSTARSRRGRFTFRFWIGDTTPPSVRLLRARGGILQVAVRDGGSGVDPASLHATIGGRRADVAYQNGVATISLAGVATGRRALVFTAADYEETKNMEDVGPVLPNTRTFRTTVTVP